MSKILFGCTLIEGIMMEICSIRLMWITCSVHEREPLLVLLRLLGGEFFLESDLFFLLVVVLEGRLNPHSAGHHAGDAFSEGVDLEEVHGSVQLVDVLRVHFTDQVCQVLIDVILEHVVLEFRGLLDVVVHCLQDLQNEFELFLVNVSDGNLNKMKKYALAFLEGFGLFDILHGTCLLLIKVVLFAVDCHLNHFYLYQKNLTIYHLKYRSINTQPFFKSALRIPSNL